MFSWLKSFVINDEIFEIIPHPGPGRNFSLDIQASKLNLKSPETISKLQSMSLVSKSILFEHKLKKIVVPERNMIFLPRHPVLLQILRGEFNLKPSQRNLVLLQIKNGNFKLRSR
jgi:hypothetical protein